MPPGAVGAPRVALSDMRSGRSRLRKERYCSRSSGCSGVSVFSIFISVFVTALPVGFCFSAFSATARLSGLGVILVKKLIH